MPPYDDFSSPEEQLAMQDMLRQRMQRYGGVTPMNFNPQAQGVNGFAPSMAMENNAEMAAGNVAGYMPPPESVAPQLPPHMQMQQNRMMANRQRAMPQQRPMQRPMQLPTDTPQMDGYRAAPPNPFMEMRNQAQNARAAMTQPMPKDRVGRVAAGLGRAGSAVGQANQMRNQIKSANKKKPVGPVVNNAPPTF